MSPSESAFSPVVLQYIRTVGLRESQELAGLREETSRMPNADWATTPEQAALLRILVQLKGARNLLEIGTFTGHATLALALAAGPSGRVTTCDMAAGWSETGRRFWRKAGVEDRIEQRIGRAQIVMAELLLEGQRGSFDMIFFDADRENYAGYLSLISQLLAPGGLLVADDTLGSGEFAEKGEDYGETQSLRAFNGTLHGDQDFDLAMLPLGQGMTLAIKK